MSFIFEITIDKNIFFPQIAYWICGSSFPNHANQTKVVQPSIVVCSEIACHRHKISGVAKALVTKATCS